MKRVLIIVSITLLIFCGIALMIICGIFQDSYIPSYEESQQNFIKNEQYFQKTEDCFLEIVRCCSISDTTWELVRFYIDESHDNFFFQLYCSMEDRWELIFPIRISGIDISQDQKEAIQSYGINPQMVEMLYSNLKRTDCCMIQKSNENNYVSFFMKYRQLKFYSINYLFYPQSIEVDSIRPVSNTLLGRRVTIITN